MVPQARMKSRRLVLRKMRPAQKNKPERKKGELALTMREPLRTKKKLAPMTLPQMKKQAQKMTQLVQTTTVPP